MQFFHFPPEYKEIRVLQEQPGRRLVLLENQKRKQKLLWRCRAILLVDVEARLINFLLRGLRRYGKF